jgi:hypothetical protein
VRNPARITAALVLLLATGCRVHFDHVRDGVAQPAERVGTLETGKTTLDDALAILGAPDGLEWCDDDDVIVYDSWSLRSSHFQVDNPQTFLGTITPQSFVGEAVTYVIFVAARTGRPAPSRAPQAVGTPPNPRSGMTTQPLTLNGDARGQERVRLFFDRNNQTLVRLEVAHSAPGGGVGGVARGTFLR